jgi:hypothetical protein
MFWCFYNGGVRSVLDLYVANYVLGTGESVEGGVYVMKTKVVDNEPFSCE